MHRVTLVSFALLLSGCSTLPPLDPQVYSHVSGVAVPTSLDRATVAGDYYRGDGLGVNIRLLLGEDGTFDSTWRGCLGVYGTAKGTWRLKKGRVLFRPKQETGLMEGELQALDVLTCEQRIILVSPRDRDLFLRRGPSRNSCFVREADKDRWGPVGRSVPGASP